jgi:hypothetical protein
MADVHAHVRISSWHRAHLLREGPKPWGILLCANAVKSFRHGDFRRDCLRTVLTREQMGNAQLSIDLGGQRILNFLP